MYDEEKEEKTNDRPILGSGASNRAAATLPSSTIPSSTKPDDEGDLLMRPRIDLDCDVLVIDIGTASIKAGWAGEDGPRCVVPSVLVETQYRGVGGNGAASEKRGAGARDGVEDGHGSHRRFGSALSSSTSTHEYHLGQAANALLSSLDDSTPPPLHVQRPLTRSLISNFDALARLLEHIFTDELHCNPKDHAVLVAFSPLCAPSLRLDLARLFFDRFNVPALLLVNSAALALFSTGATSGLVVELGEGRTTVTPVYEGFALGHAVLTQQCGGGDCTVKLAELLRARGHHFRWSQMELVRDIKEKLCKVKHKDTANTAGRPIGIKPTSREDSDLPRSPALQARPLVPGSRSSDRRPETSGSLSVSGTSSPKPETRSLPGEEDTTYELPSGEMIHLDDACVYDTMEVLFTGEIPKKEEGRASSAGSAGGETVSWAEGVKAEDEDDEDKASSNLSSSHTSAGASRNRTSGSQYRMSSPLSGSHNAHSSPVLPSHLSALSALTRDNLGIPGLIVQSLSMLDPALRAQLACRLVLAGGVSMSQGIGERVRKEVDALLGAEGDLTAGVVCDSQRAYGSWIGGSMFGSLATFGSLKVTADMWKKDEAIIHRRCV